MPVHIRGRGPPEPGARLYEIEVFLGITCLLHNKIKTFVALLQQSSCHTVQVLHSDPEAFNAALLV